MALGLNEVGKIIQIANIKADITNKELADALRISPNTLSSIQHGRMALVEDLAVDIQHFFQSRNVEIALTDYVNMDTNIDLTLHSPKHRRIVSQIARSEINDEQLEKLRTFIDQMGIKAATHSSLRRGTHSTRKGHSPSVAA